MSNYFVLNTGPTRRFCVSWPKVHNFPMFSKTDKSKLKMESDNVPFQTAGWWGDVCTRQATCGVQVARRFDGHTNYKQTSSKRGNVAYISLANVTCIAALHLFNPAALSWASSWLMDAKAIPSSCRRSWTRQDKTARDGWEMEPWNDIMTYYGNIFLASCSIYKNSSQLRSFLQACHFQASLPFFGETLPCLVWIFWQHVFCTDSVDATSILSFSQAMGKSTVITPRIYYMLLDS